MSNKIISTANFLFIVCALLSGLVCYLTVGPENMGLGIIAVLFTFVVYSAKLEVGDYLYTFIWLMLILAGCYVGVQLRLSWGFYIFLFCVSNYYYITFNRDLYSDRAIPFVVIYASLGTTMKALDLKTALGFIIGTVVTLIVLALVSKQKKDFTAFKTGIFSKSLYTNPPHVFYSALIFSGFLFLCLYIPDNLTLIKPYWAPMTFIILLKPKDQSTVRNTIDRFLGSVVGAVVVLILMQLDTHFKVFNLIVIALCAFMLPSFLKLNNLLKAFGITVFVLLLLESAEFWKDPNYNLPFARIYETFIGGVLAIIASVTLRYVRKISHRAN